MLAGWFGRTMRRAGTPFRLDGPATTLLTGGPFRYSRKPGYLSFAMILAGISLLLGGFWALAMVPAAVIKVPHDRARGTLPEAGFDEEYLRYRARVRRHS